MIIDIWEGAGMNDIALIIAKEFGLKHYQVKNTIKLIDEGNTIPFIARYRKEMTGELDDQMLRELHERLIYLRNLEERREDVRRLIDEQGKLDEEVSRALDNAMTLSEIEDIYRPFRPKRRTRASMAREKGLSPLAELIIRQHPEESPQDAAKAFIDPEKGISTEDDALNGAMDIIAETVSDNAAIRDIVRKAFRGKGIISTSNRKDESSVYDMYYDFKEAVKTIAPHRILAIFRGEREGFLDVKIEIPRDETREMIKGRFIENPSTVHSMYIGKACDDAFERLILPSVENEIRNELMERASEKAIKVFSENLRKLLLQPPVKGKVVMGLDPAYRTGCKIAVVDDTGKVLDTRVVYPTPPQNKITESKKILKDMIAKYKVDIISIGNGTASRESEVFIAELLGELDRDVYYMVVSESGASVYSASKLAAEEFPDFDVALRSAVSIARRLQDPLAELVKIDPRSIGVGQYQHDMNQNKLGQALRAVVEDCVNSVGVDLNTASPSLLSYISGINAAVAKNIVKYREENGRFQNRHQLKNVSKLGEKAFQQCAGFLRIPGGDFILDYTSVHPESYEVACKLLDILGYDLEDVKHRRLKGLSEKMGEMGLDMLSKKLGAGIPTLRDIAGELQKPGRDPREQIPGPLLQKDIMRIEDLRPGMVLTGTVRNVADFGAFVDVGVHQDGLIHISELSDSYVRNPLDVVSVGDIVKVRVLDVNIERKRISLSMKI
jgi:uncharacterized protein